MTIGKLLSAIVIIGALSAALPSHLQAVQSHSAEIPLQSAWPHAAIGSGAYASINPVFKDQAEWALLNEGASAFKTIGLGQAAIQMKHYLANTGETLLIDPRQMMNALPSWSARVEAQALQMLQQARQILANAPAEARHTIVMQSEWLPARATRQENLDWYFSVGAFSYRLALTIVGEAFPTSGNANVLRVGLTIYVYDRYDWDDGRGASVAGLYFANELIGQLHRAGLARDYDVTGIAHLDLATVLRQGCDTCATPSY